MMYMRPCEDGAFRVDLAVRRSSTARASRAVPLESIGVKHLFRILCKERLTCLATLFRATKTTGKKLSLYKVHDIRKFCVISSGELEKLRRRGGDARRIRAFHRKADAEITLLMS